MKFIAALVALLGIGALVFLGTRPSLPVHRELVSEDGRTLAATIIGKKDGILTVERDADRTRFEIPAHTLSSADRFFTFRLREEPPPPPPPPPPPKIKEETDPFILNRERAIGELGKKADLFKREIASGTLSDLLQKNRESQLEDIEKEIRALRVAIDNYRYRIKAK